jgi:YfiH family protein
METPVELIEPDWPVPDGVVALSTTRSGGHSRGPYAGFNLARHVGDRPEDVEANRQLLSGWLPPGTRISWLEQVHGARVVRAEDVDSALLPEADASYSDRPGVACAVLTADCLPVLFCAADGGCVGAAHAGWRGLRSGVLEATVAAMGVEPAHLITWLGPAIGPARFEVGPEVRDAFLTGAAGEEHAAVEACFLPAAGRDDHYLADLYALARCRLRAAGVVRIYGGGCCTYNDEKRFYSYRRDGITGRMATLVALRS